MIAGAILTSPAMLGAAVAAAAYGAGIAEWHEERQLGRRFGAEWVRYRSAVPSWVPLWRPRIVEEATLLVAFSCGTCNSIGRWLLARHPRGLAIAAAEDANDLSLRRVTYVPALGPASTGVAAIARSLEHIHLGWALVGWMLSLPGVLQFAQVIVDVCGPGPQAVAGRSYDPAACGRRP
jgi:hypothetical protein